MRVVQTEITQFPAQQKATKSLHARRCTVKSLMCACTLFHDFCDALKHKNKGAHINTTDYSVSAMKTFNWPITLKSNKLRNAEVVVQCFTSPPTQYRLYGRRNAEVNLYETAAFKCRQNITSFTIYCYYSALAELQATSAT